MAASTISRAVSRFARCRTCSTGAGQATPDEAVKLVMSGGTEGALSPHFVVFEARDVAAAPESGALAVGHARTAPLPFESLGRLRQVADVAEGVRAAMADAGLSTPDDVHFVQIKCPLLTADRVADVEARELTTATRDSLKSMSFSRAASALGVAVALGEVDRARITEDRSAATGRCSLRALRLPPAWNWSITKSSCSAPRTTGPDRCEFNIA